MLLKLTGEKFGGESARGLDFPSIRRIARYLHGLSRDTKVQIAIVVGGGNLFRGREVDGDRNVDIAQADYIGMMATVMNALALQMELEAVGAKVRVMSSLRVDEACEPFIRRRAIHHMEKGYIVVLGGGSGKPFFTTDTAAALKAAELNCDVLLKGSNVEGVYDRDPNRNPGAVLHKHITYEQALRERLMVMDMEAFSLCERRGIPIVVFSLKDLGNIRKILAGEEVGTTVTR